MSEIIWRTTGGALTVLPGRGRVLQATVGDKESFWVNPSWEGDWNVGGDRLWVGPELAWNWKTLKSPDFAQYEVPSALDGDNWRTDASGKSWCRVSKTISLRHRHRESFVELSLARCFERVDLPEASLFEHYVAYRTDNEVRLIRGSAGERIDLWSLLQVPAGGTMYAACREEVVCRNHLTAISPDLWERDGPLLLFKVTGQHQYKVGMSPATAAGKLAYARGISGKRLVIYREFFPQPWRPYCDVPMCAPESAGDAVQFYNDGGMFGGFGEMKYHSPALQFDDGAITLVDSSLTVVGLVDEKSWNGWIKRWLGGHSGR